MLSAEEARGLRRSGWRRKLRKDIDASHSAVAVAGPDAVRLQCLHDIRMVRPFEVQGNLAALAVVVSWGIAFFEYWLAVPANRWGSAVYTPVQLKTMQEVITLVVFAGFSVLYLKEPLAWNHALGFLFVAIGAFLIFHKWS
jgi:uncharacterized protein